jgi:hypothetical protein
MMKIPRPMLRLLKRTRSLALRLRVSLSFYTLNTVRILMADLLLFLSSSSVSPKASFRTPNPSFYVPSIHIASPGENDISGRTQAPSGTGFALARQELA